MKLFSNKALIKAGSWFCQLAILVWVVSTGYYLIQDGWHYYPIDPMEKEWDHLVGVLFNAGIILYVIPVFFHVIKQIENEPEEQSDK